MKVLLTGVNGFIGSKLTRKLLDNLGPNNIIALTSKKHSEVKAILYDEFFDVSSEDELLFSDVEIIVHVGSFTPKDRADSNLIMKCSENIIFTSKLLSREFKNLKKIIYFSTLDVYENYNLYTENTPIKPISLYGESKYYCEKMIECFCKERNVDCNILRVGHVYGPGEEAYKKFLPIAIQKILLGQEVELWGDGGDLRSFIYIDDVVTACINSMAKPKLPKVINVVSGFSISMKELLFKIGKLSNRDVKIKSIETSNAKNDIVFDNRLLKKYLLPTETDFDIGLLKEVEYFKRKL
ncbi:NAD-dependent epimerase/dehydratase family protein [Shewanella inventionis]|uniref:UDP-glucose 4-epimerase n=1 Tax=Shewanella inventionis TaxID=1738770 RepID=A0ABQ1J5E8_9GAMM|nr:NAD-dependent epimerase/dehydratase family protein [Shewanella inventionis]MCL1159241.1 NAD-dependent epimerase/dehydratase family protein [Shewanella inventionis]GGB60471.1 UDP-glucose 4-epimerase [Shewanella inventionis]